MKITLEVIPHEQQRLGEAGDWFFINDEELVVRVSDLGDWRMNFLFLRHEMDEAILCKYNGITTEMVDADQEKQYTAEENNPDSFSGYPGAALQYQHNDALAFEWFMSRLLGVDWKEYSAAYAKVETKVGVKK